jgi:rubrerythrin
MPDTNDTTAKVGTAFLTRLMESAEGRAHMLSVSVDAEEGDESGIFDQVANLVEDPELRRIVERHRDDEVRHARLFRECLARLGEDKRHIADEIRVIRQVGARTDRPEGTVRNVDDIVDVYALLLAIEERGVEQFPRVADAFEPHDPETASVYRRVARDERGHVRYCQRIGRHYASSDEEWDAAVARARVMEEDAFVAVGLANLTYCAEQGWVDMDEVVGAVEA